MYPLNKGFTLIELMIVVAIIGILAAVAVPGFMRYIKSSKTAEATENINSITKGAMAYFQAEHCFDATCLSPKTGIWPGCAAEGDTYSACPATTKVGNTSHATTIGTKKAPVASDFAGAPWSSLKLNINQPYYYEYLYASSATVAADKGVTTNGLFAAQANASLSTACDSTFYVSGNNGVVGNIIDKSVETGSCPTFALPSTTP